MHASKVVFTVTTHMGGGGGGGGIAWVMNVQNVQVMVPDIASQELCFVGKHGTKVKAKNVPFMAQSALSLVPRPLPLRRCSEWEGPGYKAKCTLSSSAPYGLFL